MAADDCGESCGVVCYIYGVVLRGRTQGEKAAVFVVFVAARSSLLEHFSNTLQEKSLLKIIDFDSVVKNTKSQNQLF